MKKSFRTMLSVLAVMLLAGAANAQVKGTIYKHDGAMVSGLIRYLKSSKQYEIKQGAIQVRISDREVARLRIVEPGEIKQASSLMSKKQYSSAIPLLRRVEQKYQYLQWDAIARRGLAECYFESNQGAEGIRIVKRAMEDDGGESLSPRVVNAYWDELIKLKKYSDLEKSIETIIQNGARPVAAAAQVKRGDMLKDKGETKNAVVDGYLRTVVFYTEQKEAREEATYKAMRAFQDLGQQTYADKMRNILNSDYPKGKWTKKAQDGV